MNHHSKQGRVIKPLPYPIYFGTVALLTLGGLFDAVYLSISHYRVYTDMGYRSFCAISQAINCDTVSQSPYSIFLNVPVPVWGIIGYVLVLMLLPFAGCKQAKKKRIWPLLCLISLVFVIISIVLAWISSFEIHSYCIMCLVSYGINFLLLYYTWMILRRFGNDGLLAGLWRDLHFLMARKTQSLTAFVPFVAGLILVLIFFPVYWSFATPALSAYMPHGLTPDGHPWIGAAQPRLEIVEFTDYRCFQWNKMHFFLRQLMAQHPDRIRLIHRHFPMDHEVNPIVKQPLHVGSGKLAMLTIYAASQNKFWQLSDVLFKIARIRPEINIKELADATGLNSAGLRRALRSPKIRDILKADIKEALALGVNGTPSFLIDGKVYQGQVPPEIIKKALD